MNKKLSRPIDEMFPHYEVIVIGSGYGGGVSASRLARAGSDVCVIERGREIQPGSYPETIEKVAPEVQVDTPHGQIGNPMGLYDIRTNPDMNVLLGCGLGGTSLINANVSLEVKKDLFSRNCWPKEFRSNTSLLDEYYKTARQMLGANPYPDHFPKLAKVEALEHAAKTMGEGCHFKKAPINVNFQEGVNYAGVKQDACNLCGDCVTGCNVGAKNTTLMNYLPDAVNHGAQIFCELEAHLIKKVGKKWSVTVKSRHADNDFSKEITAETVIIAAGTLGTTELLLRSKAEGLPVSSKLGSRFSGNGDIYCHAYDAYKTTDVATDETIIENIVGLLKKLKPNENKPKASSAYANGVGSLSVAEAKRPGPCIAGVIDLRQEDKEIHERLVIQEGSIARVFAEGVEPSFFFRNATEGNFFKYGPAQMASRLEDAEKSANKLLQNDLTSDPYSGVMSRVQTYLAMGHDATSGKMKLDDKGRIRIDWPGAGRDPAIVNDNRVLEEVCEAVHGQYLPNPIWNKGTGWKLLTVHPVGGCRMADTAEHGVVNHACQVFSSDEGSAVHEGLYICDGSVLPESIGVNPLLTITAIAERACHLLCQSKAWTYNEKKQFTYIVSISKNPFRWLTKRLNFKLKQVTQTFDRGVRFVGTKVLQKLIQKYPSIYSPSLGFSEAMRGFIKTQLNGPESNKKPRFANEYQIAEDQGKRLGQAMLGRFTVHIANIEHMITDPDHEAKLTGSIESSALHSEAMILKDGKFNLFQIDQDKAASWFMRYRGWLEVSGQRRYFFDGFKKLEKTSDSHWLSDTMTLNVKVYDGNPKEDANVIALGILRLEVDELLNQLTSVKVEPGESRRLRQIQNLFPEIYKGISAISIGNFVGFFSQTVIEAYGDLLANLANFPEQKNTVAAKSRRSLNAPAAKVYSSSKEKDGKFKLTRYQGGSRGPVILAPGFSVRASSFATTTVDKNLVEYLVSHEYDVWLFDYRASPSSGHSTENFTIDDIAIKDWFGAVETVREVTGERSVQVIAHCVGAMTLMMALCEGLQGVRHTILSQLTLHPVTSWLNYLKADIDIGKILQQQGFDSININTSESKQDKILDTLLWNVPMPEGEAYNNPVSRRIFSVFGASYAHAQLNEQTHNALSEMFGEISTSPSAQLSKIIDAGHAVDASGQNRYLPQVDRLAIPMDFIVGGKNQIFHPETSKRTIDWLKEHNGSSLYTRTIFSEYAHMDFFIGKRADKEIYPYLLQRLEKHTDAI